MESFTPSSEGLQVALDADAVIQNNLTSRKRLNVHFFVKEERVCICVS